MKTFRKTLILVFLSFIFLNLNAQVENILKNSIPELYGNLKITPGKVYDTKDKDAYRNLFYKLNDALTDIRQVELGLATSETMLALDYKTLKQIAKNEILDSLFTIIKSYQRGIIDFMKFHERFGADSINVGLYYTGFKDNFTAKKYDVAYKNWSVLFNDYPIISSSVYSGGSNLLKYFIQTTKDSVVRQKYIDTLFLLYDQQIKVYPANKGYIIGKQAIDYYNIFINKKDLNSPIVRTHIAKNYEMTMEAINYSGDSTKYYMFPIAMKLTFILQMIDSLSSDQALDNYLRFSDILSKEYAAETNEAEQKKIKEDGIDVIDNFFTKSSLSTCEYLCPTFQKKYDRDPQNVNNLKTILTILGQKACTDCQLYSDVAVSLNKIQPNATSAHGVALLYASKEKYNDALPYIDQAIKLETDNLLKAQYYFEGAQMYNKLKSFVTARDYARKALDLNPKLGNAYILIATMYAVTANSVGDDQFSHNAVFWAAVDKLNQAKNVDPSVASDANSLISTYSAHFPKKEEGFMHSVLEGNSYTVGGWIGETTSARYYK